MPAKKQKGYRYPTGKLNQLAKAYVGGNIMGTNSAPTDASVDPLDEMGDYNPANNNIRPALTRGNNTAMPVNSELPPDPTLHKPSHWANIVKGLSKGIINIDQSDIKNQLELQKYNFQLQQLINNGQFEQAKALAEAKGAADLAKAQQEQKDKVEFENITHKNKLAAQDNQNLGTRGYIGPSAAELYQAPGSGLDKTLATDKADFLKNRITADTLISPEGESGFRDSLIQAFRKGGVDNKATEATTGLTNVKAKMEQFLKLGAGDAAVHPFNTGLSFQNIPGRTEESISPEGLPIKRNIPGEVVGINAQDGTRVTIRPVAGAGVRPPLSRNSSSSGAITPMQPTGGINPIMPSPEIPAQPDNKDVEFFDLLIKRLKDQMGYQPNINF